MKDHRHSVLAETRRELRSEEPAALSDWLPPCETIDEYGCVHLDDNQVPLALMYAFGLLRSEAHAIEACENIVALLDDQGTLVVTHRQEIPLELEIALGWAWYHVACREEIRFEPLHRSDEGRGEAAPPDTDPDSKKPSR